MMLLRPQNMLRALLPRSVKSAKWSFVALFRDSFSKRWPPQEYRQDRRLLNISDVVAVQCAHRLAYPLKRGPPLTK